MSQAVETDDRDDLEDGADDEAVASVHTNGDPIRSWARISTALVDECKLHLDSDGMHVKAVDPANVGMVKTTFPAEGFRSFELADDELVFGVSLEKLTSALTWARKRGDDGDPVRVEFFTDPDRMRVSITRTDQRMKRVSEWFGVDPDMIREEPDLPDLDLPDRADPDPVNLIEAVEAVDAHEDYAYLTRDGDTFVLSTREGGDTTLGADDDEDAESGAVFMPETAWSENGGESTSSLFSLDYLKDMAEAIKKSKADRMTVQWGEDFPVKLFFEHEDWGISSQFLLAPRMEDT